MTIREHAEAIDDLTWGGDERHMPEIRKHAQAILDALDAAQWDGYGKEHLRLVHDPHAPKELMRVAVCPVCSGAHVAGESHSCEITADACRRGDAT